MVRGQGSQKKPLYCPETASVSIAFWLAGWLCREFQRQIPKPLRENNAALADSHSTQAALANFYVPLCRTHISRRGLKLWYSWVVTALDAVNGCKGERTMEETKKTEETEEMKETKKTLIFCFDGTCNDPEDAENFAEDGSITNILKLHVLFGGYLCDKSKNQPDDGTIVTADGSRQQSFYYSGVGTYGGRLRKLLNMALAPKHLDVNRILNDAIENLVEHYEKGDHVLVFGFSRGAALARMFASVAKERLEKKKPKETGLEIDFLGVFDTVAAISGTDLSVKTKPASDVVFEDGVMSQDVKKAVHLVALDENRVAFQPTLFDYDSRRITEVWFPGVHADVGGGYWYDGLSDLALEYMTKKVEQECAGYAQILDLNKVKQDQLTDKKCSNDEDYTLITKDDIEIKALVDGVLHEHKQKTTSTATAVIAGVLVGAIVCAIVCALAGAIAGVIFGAIVGVIIGVVVRKKVRKIRLHPREVRIAGEHPEGEHPMVHVSVQHRYKKVRGYRPHALRDVKIRWVCETGGKPSGLRRVTIKTYRWLCKEKKRASCPKRAAIKICRWLCEEKQKTPGFEYFVVGNSIQSEDKGQKASGHKGAATENRIQPSKAGQKDTGSKYFVAADDKHVGDLRQGISGLGGGNRGHRHNGCR